VHRKTFAFVTVLVSVFLLLFIPMADWPNNAVKQLALLLVFAGTLFAHTQQTGTAHLH